MFLPLRGEEQLRGRLPHLADAAGRRLELQREHRLHRVDDDQGGPQTRDLFEDPLEAGLRQQIERRPALVEFRGAEPLSSGLDLMLGFLARAVQDRSGRVREVRGRLQQERRLADARLAADQDERSRHNAAAQHAIEFADAGGEARRYHRVDVFVQPRPGRRSERIPVARGRRRRAAARTLGNRLLLDERVPRTAVRAAAKPFLRLRAAFLAGVDRLRFH